MMMKKLLLSVCVGLCIEAGVAQTLKVWPGTPVGSGVTYGADVKLTLFRIATSDYDAVNQKFDAMGMDMVRVPIIAHWGADDSRYNTIKTYVNNAKANGLNVFASVANTNGQFKPNGDLDDAHGGDKFPSWLKCNGGCTTDNTGLYDVKRSKYKLYLEDVVLNKIGNVSWVGPWNEDNANPDDYSKLDFGKSIIGAELWSLSKSADEMNEVSSVIDIGGAHNYDNSSNLLLAYTDWKKFVNAGGDWFTESTLFAQSVAAGIAHMLPAMSAGIKKIIIYQTVPRVITTSGGNAPAYTAVNELIRYSKGKGAALQVETNNQNYVASAFKSGNQLILHVCNISASTEMLQINLQGYSVSTSGVSVAKFGGTTADVTVANQGKQVKVNLSANTYARIVLNGLTSSARQSFEAETDLQAQQGLLVYPNPVNQKEIHVQLPASETASKVQVRLLDMLGKVVVQQAYTGLTNFRLPLQSGLSKGLYKLVVQTDSQTYTRSVVVEQ